MNRLCQVALGIVMLTGCPPRPARLPASGANRGRPTEVTEKPRETKAREVKKLKLPSSMIIGDNVTLSGFHEDAEDAKPPNKPAPDPTCKP